MSRPRKAGQLELGAKEPKPKPPPDTQPLAAVAEYADPAYGDRWRVERFDLLSSEFGLTRDMLPRFHLLVSAADGPLARAWTIVRRLYGMQPIIPPAGTAPEDLEIWTREALQERLGITAAQLRQDLDGLRLWWQKSSGDHEAAAKTQDRRPESLLTDDDILREHGFPDAMFQVRGRAPEDNRTERMHFAQRVRTWASMLSHPMAGKMARQALLNELKINRDEIEVLQLPRQSKDDEAMYRSRQQQLLELQGVYQDQLAALDKVFPWIGAVAGKQSFVGVISDMVRGYREYYASGDNTIVDGMNTSLEIHVLLRSSQQLPDAQYRLGLVAHVAAARAGIWNPAWRAQFRPNDLKKLEAGFREGVARMSEDLAEHRPDLLADGAAGEYEPLPDV